LVDGDGRDQVSLGSSGTAVGRRQELLRVDDDVGEIDLWCLADLLPEDGFSLEE
jgi:hypothetical protein